VIVNGGYVEDFDIVNISRKMMSMLTWIANSGLSWAARENFADNVEDKCVHNSCDDCFIFGVDGRTGHMNHNLGLVTIRNTIPEIVRMLKKNI